jgi:hypothetical protein
VINEDARIEKHGVVRVDMSLDDNIHEIAKSEA